MYNTKIINEDLELILNRILILSNRISLHSAPMKPFILFFNKINDIFYKDNSKYSKFLWNFDNELQNILLRIIKLIASPGQLMGATIKRWKINMERQFADSKRQLNDLINQKKIFQFNYLTRDKFIFTRVPAGARFLYVGCGTGTDCLRFANQGYKVVGIDTDFKLTKIANEWSKYFSLPFKAICMDVMSLGFSKDMFDSFLIEFYGHQPLLHQSLLIQQNLSAILRKGGKGFFVASRKGYVPHMALRSGRYPTSMIAWLFGQISLDYLHSPAKGSEEHLGFGLYWRSHTINSISTELKKFFNVLECQYEKDPRYVICVVESKGKKEIDCYEGVKTFISDWDDVPNQQIDDITIEKVLFKVEHICDLLAAHESNVIQFFENNLSSKQSLFQSIDVDLPEFMNQTCF